MSLDTFIHYSSWALPVQNQLSSEPDPGDHNDANWQYVWVCRPANTRSPRHFRGCCTPGTFAGHQIQDRKIMQLVHGKRCPRVVTAATPPVQFWGPAGKLQGRSHGLGPRHVAGVCHGASVGGVEAGRVLQHPVTCTWKESRSSFHNNCQRMDTSSPVNVVPRHRRTALKIKPHIK